MMRGGRLILLKAGRWRAESPQQAEIRLAGLLKILGIFRCAQTCSQKAKRTCDGCGAADFREVWLIGRSLRRMLSGSQF
jgi:hypothetical protein